MPERRSAFGGAVTDLKQRGLLDDTLVIWGGEFGRTVYCQGKLMDGNYGRDHHPRCFSIWMAGAASSRASRTVKPTTSRITWCRIRCMFTTCRLTILRCLGIDHKRLTFKFQGRHFRLTDVAGEVMDKLMA